MVKVRGFVPKEYETICDCNAILVYEESDIEDSYMPGGLMRFVKCPNCKNKLLVG